MSFRGAIPAWAYAGLLMAGLTATNGAAQSAAGPVAGKVEIELRGEIRPSCTMTGAVSNLGIGGVSGGGDGQSQLGFRLSCNAPFSYSLSSLHGAMRSGSGASGKGLAGELPYRATLTIPAEDGSSLVLDCGADQLGAAAGGCHGVSGDRVAIDKDASLTVRWGLNEAHLAAGRYTDDLRIAIGVGN